jgi:hypothetical protein
VSIAEIQQAEEALDGLMWSEVALGNLIDELFSLIVMS